MFKKFLISIVVIVILVVLGGIVFGKKTEAPALESLENSDTENREEISTSTESIDTIQAPVTPPSNTQEWKEFDGEIDRGNGRRVVAYTNSGFEHGKISVEYGQIVRFDNKSDGPMWVASDFHPSHNIYPEFDSKKSIPPGSSYEFKFTKVGKWNYHDHLNPNHTGYVVVEGREARDAKRIFDLKQLQFALELYFYSNGTYPKSLSDLVDKQIGQLPVDPLTSNNYMYYGLKTNCTSYHMGAVLEDSRNQILQGDLDAPARSSEATACVVGATDFDGRLANVYDVVGPLD